jgi:hypothetical protein
MDVAGTRRSLLAGILVLQACSGSSSVNGEWDDYAGRDAGNDAGKAGDAARPVPQFVYGPPGGTLPGLLSSVDIVTATWTRDTEDITAQIATAFAATALGGSAWWAALGSYCVPGGSPCVGPTVSVTPAQIGDAPAYPIVDSATMQNLSNDGFARFIRDKSTPSLHVLPAPVTASTLYVVFMPLSLPADQKGPGLQPGYVVTVDGAASCGYHSATMSGAGPNVAYVVVPRCQVSGQSDADVAIATAFRGIADAVTDPFRALGSSGFHNMLAPPQGFEIGDVCSGTTGTASGVADLSLPQIWSSAGASCVP